MIALYRGQKIDFIIHRYIHGVIKCDDYKALCVILKAYLLSLHDVDDRVGQFLLFRDARCIGKEIELKLDDIAASISLRPETVPG